MKSLAVVSPVYNEEEVIEAFYRRLKGVLAGVSESYDSTIIFVVDRSSDRTLEILKRLAETDRSLRIVALSSRFGHQRSLLAGIDHSNADAVVTIDSDLQHPPELIPDLLREFERGNDVVYTIREDVEGGFLRRLASRVFYRSLNRIAAVPIQENAADFRLLSRRVVEVFQTQIRERNQFLRGLVAWVGFASVGVRFRVEKRKAGKSKYTLGGLVRFGIDGVVSFSKRPLQAAIYLGLVIALFGFAFAVFTVVDYFFSRDFPSGWATLTILLTIFSGTQLVFLGVIGEYIGTVFDEVKARPHYIVEERVNFGAEPAGGAELPGREEEPVTARYPR